LKLFEFIARLSFRLAKTKKGRLRLLGSMGFDIDILEPYTAKKNYLHLIALFISCTTMLSYAVTIQFLGLSDDNFSNQLIKVFVSATIFPVICICSFQFEKFRWEFEDQFEMPSRYIENFLSIIAATSSLLICIVTIFLYALITQEMLETVFIEMHKLLPWSFPFFIFTAIFTKYIVKIPYRHISYNLYEGLFLCIMTTLFTVPTYLFLLEKPDFYWNMNITSNFWLMVVPISIISFFYGLILPSLYRKLKDSGKIF